MAVSPVAAIEGRHNRTRYAQHRPRDGQQKSRQEGGKSQLRKPTRAPEGEHAQAASLAKVD